jgi:diguanylate cyclase (GGDEF)-like protein
MSPPSAPRRRRIAQVIPIAVVLASFAMVGSLGAALEAAQQGGKRQLSERFQARGDLASKFAATWVTQLTAEESSAAVNWLSGTDHLDSALATAADVFDFRTAVVLDSLGVALASYPDVPGLVGSDVASRYEHLSAALESGQPAASSVVVSASRGVPVVEFAVPYYTPNGRRLFSGAYELRQLPLGAFLSSVTPIPGSQVYAVGADGTIVGSARVGDDGEPPSHLPPALRAANAQATEGDYTDAKNRGHYFTTHAVEGTPWSLILTAPHDTLYAPIGGRGHDLPWMVLGVVALLVTAADWLLFRLLRGRDRLRVLNAALDTSARTDQLTSLPNRRHLDDVIVAAMSAGDRHAVPVSLLMIDLDHFKRVNDTYGHTTGDHVLQHVAALLQAAVRTEDVVGRWGGEEFLAVLPHTDETGASRIAERIRESVGTSPYTNNAGDRIIVTTLSVGCATMVSGGDKDELIHRADQALYAAKSAGRDVVLSAPSYDVVA